MIPKELQTFIERFEKIPALGPRQATRLAFRLVGQGKQAINDLREGLQGLEEVKVCSQCFFVHTQKESLCPLCTNPHRAHDVFMIVEKETDLISIEKTNKYAGQYLVLGDLSRSGAWESWQKIRIANLKRRIEKECPDKKAKEIIVAFNLTTYGDLGVALLKKELADYTHRITGLGRGIPTGGEIEFADKDTLSSSLERRQ